MLAILLRCLICRGGGLSGRLIPATIGEEDPLKVLVASSSKYGMCDDEDFVEAPVMLRRGLSGGLVPATNDEENPVEVPNASFVDSGMDSGMRDDEALAKVPV